MIHISVCLEAVYLMHLPQCLQICHPLRTNVSFNHVDAKAKGSGENTLHLLVPSLGCYVILLSRALTADTKTAYAEIRRILFYLLYLYHLMCVNLYYMVR